ncbi:DUF1206 domain-containing protein [Colwellia sp. PAMC 21821]|uniref:DUF1206 domain-containing protein n=1 Tax=Colwellia sp. PAMC 21821 TaxID=1816219 RepID=UPI0009C3B1BF|nr:DUF1206 domain-containing protein [Colwellia sp. PAMC 21821]ARD44033.1 hypothetical protein A3Q33_06725 [Colwellia sp. PAMC 21821]
MNKEKKQWLIYVGRVGYAAKSVIYAVLGFLIVYSAYYSTGVEHISKDVVFSKILGTPFGYISLTALIIGLICYVAWRLIQGVLNPKNLTNKPKDLILRFFYFISAMLYCSVAYTAYSALTWTSKSGKGQSLSAKLMGHEWGIWLLGALGLIVICFGFIQLKHAIKIDFMDKFDSSKMSGGEIKATKKAGRYGFAARSLIYWIVGYFIIYAAYSKNPDEAGGLGKALSTLLEQPFGVYLLGTMGLGMACFSIFCALEARYRTI